MTRRELFRLRIGNKLIDKIDDWMDFHSARNRTSHIYDEEIAQRVSDIAKKFLPYAKDLLLYFGVKKMVYVYNHELEIILKILKKYVPDLELKITNKKG